MDFESTCASEKTEPTPPATFELDELDVQIVMSFAYLNGLFPTMSS